MHYIHMQKKCTLVIALVLCFSIFTAAAIPALAEDTSPHQYNYSLNDNGCSDLDDPFISINRKIFIFNSVLDLFLLRPVAKGYKAVFSQYARDRVGNFIDNMNTPLSVVSNTMQLEPEHALTSFWKFVINSTLGVGGLYDVAEKLDIQSSQQTFGSMLARYGVGPGPYVILPFFGGTNVRDMWDAPLLNAQLNPLKQAMHQDFLNIVTAVSLVSKRAEIMEFTDYISKNSADPYAAIRSAIHQKREAELRYPSSYHCRNNLN